VTNFLIDPLDEPLHIRGVGVTAIVLPPGKISRQ
jgi:hypothetical protein